MTTKIIKDIQDSLKIDTSFFRWAIKGNDDAETDFTDITITPGVTDLFIKNYGNLVATSAPGIEIEAGDGAGTTRFVNYEDAVIEFKGESQFLIKRDGTVFENRGAIEAVGKSYGDPSNAILDVQANDVKIYNSGNITSSAGIDLDGTNIRLVNSGNITSTNFFTEAVIHVKANSVDGSIYNSGDISGTGGGILVNEGSDGFYVKNTGTINLRSGVAVSFWGSSDNIKVVNYGEIYGTLGVTLSDVTNAVIKNYGKIQSEEGRSIGIYNGADNTKIVNTGEITADFGVTIRFVGLDNTSYNKVENREGGVIWSSRIEIQDEFAIIGSNGTQDIKNDGHIHGSIKLGNGLDYYRGSGTIEGAVYGESGTDRFYGAESGEEFHGGDDRDILRGNGGNDKLFGDGGADYLVDGAGSDMMEGGEGRDKFVFAGLDSLATDTITDFADNEDRLDLRLTGLTNLAAVALHLEDDADGNAVFTADSGNVLIIENITVADLLDDIII